MNSCDAKMYARMIDLTGFYMRWAFKLVADVVSQVNHDMTKLTGWFNTNKLSVNLDKTKCMFFSKNAHEDCKLPILEVNGIQRKFVNNFSYLGIVLDNKLQFNDHQK